MKFLITCQLCICIFSCTFASTKEGNVERLSGAVGDTNKVILKRGTIVTLETYENLSSATATEHSVVEMSVYNNVAIAKDIIAISKGAFAQVELTEVRKAGAYGRPGRIEVSALTVKTVEGVLIPLEGTTTIGLGTSRRALAFGLSLGIPFIGFLVLNSPWVILGLLVGIGIKGKNVKAPAGTKINGRVAKDVVIKKW